MNSGKKFVAILTSSPALGSILAMVMDCEEGLSVQNFTRPQNLQQHMRIAPIDMIVCDYDLYPATAAQIAIELRLSNPAQKFQIIALTEFLSPQIRQACKFASIDEVIVKPMSPLFVRERVLSRLNIRNSAKAEKPPEYISRRSARFDAPNIVELFAGKTATPIDQMHPQ